MGDEGGFEVSIKDDTRNELLDTLDCGIFKFCELDNGELHFGSNWFLVEDWNADDNKLL